MNDGFQFIDIIFFAMVAAFLVLRLRSVLGRRTGHEQQRPDPFARPRQGSENVVDLPDRRPRPAEPGGGDRFADMPAGSTLTAIALADPSFTPQSFLEGARAAFTMIVGAFAAGDSQALRPLLDDTVFADFKSAIDSRQAAGETQQTEVVGIKSAKIDDATLEGSVASVTVEFVTEQITALRDAKGEVVEGDPARVHQVTDIWTFARDTRSRDPNWHLVATRTPEE